MIPEAVTSLGLQVATIDAPAGCVLAQRGMTANSYGENVAIFAEPAGEHATRVEVVSKKTMETNILAPDWAPEVLQKLDQMLVKPAPEKLAASPTMPVQVVLPTALPVSATPEPMF